MKGRKASGRITEHRSEQISRKMKVFGEIRNIPLSDMMKTDDRQSFSVMDVTLGVEA